MPQILLAGAPTGCWTNLGDQAILAGMLRGLRAAAPEAEIAVVSSNPSGFLAAHGCEEVPFADVEAMLEAVGSADLVLLGGGSIFFDYWGCDLEAVLTPRHHGLALWASIALAAAAHGTRLAVYAAGVGPLRSAEGRLVTRAIFEMAAGATLRDSASLETLRELGVEGDAASLTADPALAVELPDPPPLDSPRPWLGVALRQWDIETDQGRWQVQCSKAIARSLRRTGGSVIFVPCHRAVAWPLTDDEAAAQAVAGSLAPEQVRVVDVELPWQERASLLASCDRALAMRYHAALFALRGGVPTAGLSYDPKVSGLFAEWSLDPLCLDLGNLDHRRLARLLTRLSSRPEIAAEITEMAAAQRTRELRNAELVAELLASPPGAAPAGHGALGRLIETVGDPDDRPELATELLGRIRSRAPSSSSPSAAGAPRSSKPKATPGGEPSPITPARCGAESRRVAILTNRVLDRDTGEPCLGGAERYALALARLLSDLGLAPTLFQREGEGGDFYGFPVIGLPRGDHFSEFENGVASQFLERAADFDHAIYLAPNYAAGPLRDDALVVCHGIWWDHDLWGHLQFRTPEWYEHLERVFTRPKRIVSVDGNSINVVRALFPSAVARMTFIPNWVDTEVFHPPDRREADPPMVLFPRRADVIRGPRLVAPILEHLPDPCRLLWAGDGDPGLLAELEELSRSDPRFSLTSAPFDEMPDLYRAADICVIPTLGSEGQSLACLEAMASGCAVVVTNVGGLPELVEDGVDGLVCEPTPSAIAASIARLLRDPQLRFRLGSAARSSAERHSLGTWRARWARLLLEEGWVPDTASANPYDVVCFSIVNWEFRWQRPQQMMSRWGERGRRVFFLRVSEFLAPGERPSAEEIAENVWEVRLALPEGFDPYAGTHPEGFGEIGMESLADLRERFGIGSAVSVVELANWAPLAFASREAWGWPVVYDCMDDWSTFPGFSETPPFLAWEEKLVENTDLLVVSSETISRRWVSRRPDLLLARNAADFEFFRDPHGPDPLEGVAGPVAGFFGAITEWFDMELMEQVARARPDVTFVLVGGVHRTSAEALERLANVRLEGQRPYETMPLYLRRFDACMIPFRVSVVTDGMDVVKFYEYISQGKPVVTTPIREMLHYRDLVHLARDPDEFITKLDHALGEDDPSLRHRRVELARQNTWDERLDRLEERILPVIEQRIRSGG